MQHCKAFVVTLVSLPPGSICSLPLESVDWWLEFEISLCLFVLKLGKIRGVFFLKIFYFFNFHRHHQNLNKHEQLPPTMAHYRQIHRHLHYMYHKPNFNEYG